MTTTRIKSLVLLGTALSLLACSNVVTIAKASPNDRLNAVEQIYQTAAKQEKAYADACKATPVAGCAEIVADMKTADNLAYGALTQAEAAYTAGNNTDLAFLIGLAEGGTKVFASIGGV